MVDKGKSKQALFKGLKEDKISELPDSLICQILCHLPTKEAVRTSVLSTRWRSLWLWFYRLELISSDFPDFDAFVSCGNRFLDSNRVSSIDELKLSITGNVDGVDDVDFHLKSWIDAAIKRKIIHLYVLCSSYYMMPASLYICETLVSLELILVTLVNAEVVSLPCLKTMRLHLIECPNEATFERLVSSCPVLEELELETRVSFEAIVFRVLSRSLKKLTITKHYCMNVLGSGVVIDAPELRFLSITDNLSERFIITNMNANVKLYLSLSFQFLFYRKSSFPSEKYCFRRYLPLISMVKDMTISTHTFTFICHYLKSEPLPQFVYMSRLHVTFYVSKLKWLPTFLESFPNLKSLTVEVYSGDYEKFNGIRFSYVPECLLSSLEFVDFKQPINGYVPEMKLAKYFLKNSVILKKLTLCLHSDSRKDYILKKLLKIPRASTECKLVVL